ncbi:NAD(P)-dependent dehydrogenase (short-subunit alcohol dehydrogenase family) [Actinomadura coerulea]|uniref:NAD(P)-dependent dehydrogenase (Short-subunit alcohol dehydrogenase family) n=1 Tax=Actinomadura coerulea TaxID=46159 RepID=A0A7X0G2K0_9ACTN|nr:SDR family NAD(P)-dependent oxidoreductase [Actinomadura coerulea]MBB6397540.1 NAD(P)-dependent dehydrogenase (short-subunit alcohol dehydrogenase family) [Actinomadura coerulea]GGQ03329.1 putative short-chain dehydrogenase/reductase [Actinomadura coerulea]
MERRIAIVTGGTSGIGKEIARGLARAGMLVGIVCRNELRAAATVEELTADVPGARVETFIGDLSVQMDVRRVAASLEERFDRLDVLVDNAGVYLLRAKVSADGYDRVIATNHLGPFLLTNLLLGLLEKGAPSRVVVMASEAHRFSDRLDVDRMAEPGSYGPGGALRVYGRSKLLNILFAQELARRMEGSGVTANAVCPGLVATSLGRDVRGTERLLSLFSHTPVMRTPEQGARMALRLALDEEFEGRSGGYYSSRPGAGRLPAVGAVKDPELRRAVWDRSVRLVGLPAL